MDTHRDTIFSIYALLGFEGHTGSDIVCDMGMPYPGLIETFIIRRLIYADSHFDHGCRRA
jgi:hypothetical protein